MLPDDRHIDNSDKHLRSVNSQMDSTGTVGKQFKKFLLEIVTRRLIPSILLLVFFCTFSVSSSVTKAEQHVPTGRLPVLAHQQLLHGFFAEGCTYRLDTI